MKLSTSKAGSGRCESFRSWLESILFRYAQSGRPFNSLPYRDFLTMPVSTRTWRQILMRLNKAHVRPMWDIDYALPFKMFVYRMILSWIFWNTYPVSFRCLDSHGNLRAPHFSPHSPVCVCFFNSGISYPSRRPKLHIVHGNLRVKKPRLTVRRKKLWKGHKRKLRNRSWEEVSVPLFIWLLIFIAFARPVWRKEGACDKPSEL